jgi:hypothetical protein
MDVVTKPTVLISSTVHDFSDLRSALRYWLTELGYDVFLSEFNDFPKELDDNSYESCLKVIKNVDYFILLIGARKGGWYDRDKGITITRMEYMEAIKHFRATGKPKLAVFVRQNLWDIREDRSALTKCMVDNHADQKELSEEARAGIIQHQSRFVNDANTIFDFLQEVGQVEDMKTAASGKGELPKANWIHLFTRFEDIALALRTALGITGHAEQEILVANLKHELKQNLKYLLCKGSKGSATLIPVCDFAISVLPRLTDNIDAESTIAGSDLTRLVMFWVLSGPVPHWLSTIFIETSIESGLFMSYDVKTGQYMTTKTHEALLELLGLIKSARKNPRSTQDIIDLSNKYQTGSVNRDEQYTITNMDFVFLLGDAKSLARVTELTSRLLLWMDGESDIFNNLNKWTRTPFSDEAEKMHQEEVSLDEVTRWLEKFAK